MESAGTETHIPGIVNSLCEVLQTREGRAHWRSLETPRITGADRERGEEA